MTFEQTIGTRAQVWHGTAKKTNGGLTKSHLLMNKHGRIVSKKKHHSAKKEKRLVKAGFLTKKGHFGFIKKGSKKQRGGTGMSTGMNHPAVGSAIANLMAGKTNGMPTELKHMKGGAHHNVGLPHHMMLKKGGAHHNVGLPHHMMLKKGGKSRKMRGGTALGGPLSPHSYDGQGVGTSGVSLQFVAGQAA
jgi:hypothetical protein